MSEFTEGIKRAIRFRIGQMVSRILLTAIDDTGLDARGSVSHQRVDGDTFASGGTNRNASRFQDYGVTSVPLVGSEGIALQIGGSQSRLAIINVDDPRHRPTNLAPGEVQIYTDEGLVLHAKRGRIVELAGNAIAIDAGSGDADITASGAINIDAGSGDADINASGAVNIGGTTVVITGTITLEGKAWATHTHSADVLLGGSINSPAGIAGGPCTGATGPPL
jgi:phage baseplate assembly protein V